GARYLHLSGPDHGAATILGRSRLRDIAAAGYGSRRRHLPPRHFPARDRPGKLERRLRATEPPPRRRPLRRKPEPPAALLSIPGRAEAVARQHPRSVSRFAAPARLRSAGTR